MKIKILLLGEITSKLRDTLLEEGFLLTLEPEDDVVCIIVRGGIVVDKNLIDSLSNLKFIISAGIGTDNIDITYANKKNIKVSNCPISSAITTAEHTISLFLTATKKISKADSELKRGIWDRKNNITIEIYGKTITVIGLGNIGSYVAKLYKSLGMNVRGYDPVLHNYYFSKIGVNRVHSLEEAFSGSNFISLHVSKNQETVGMINQSHLDLLNKPCGIINTSRGGIINEDLILKNLDNGTLDFYATDVYESEPNPNQILINHSKVIATPHIGANSSEAQLQIALDTVKQVKEFFNV